MNRQTHFESGAAKEGRSHIFHEIGRTECVAEGCEPKTPERPMVEPYEQQVRDEAKALGGRALLGGNAQARAIAHKRLAKREGR